MSAAKNRKIDNDGRYFNSEWCSKYLVPHNEGVVSLVCQNTIAVMKEYNAKRHYATKHSSQFDDILSQARVDKIEHLENPSRPAVFLPVTKKDTELVKNRALRYVTLW